MTDRNLTRYRLGRRPGEQGPRSLPRNQGRVEKSDTGTIPIPTTAQGTEKLKMAKDLFTVGTWNV